MKISVAVLFGGKSVEHEISVISAVQAMGYLDKETRKIFPIVPQEEEPAAEEVPAEDAPAEEAPAAETPDAEAPAAEGGCGSFIGGGAIVITAILGAAWVSKRK